MVHVAGVKHKVADASSRFPTGPSVHFDIATIQACGEIGRLSQELSRRSFRSPTEEEISDADDIELGVRSATVAALHVQTGDAASVSCPVMSWDKLEEASRLDEDVKIILTTLRSGVKDDRWSWPPALAD